MISIQLKILFTNSHLLGDVINRIRISIKNMYVIIRSECTKILTALSFCSMPFTSWVELLVIFVDLPVLFIVPFLHTVFTITDASELTMRIIIEPARSNT